jgi:hypothetical protein
VDGLISSTHFYVKNMKFKSLLDKKSFLIEIEEFKLATDIDDSWVPTQELIELFVKKRKELITRLKDFRKQQTSKDIWREKRYKIMKGIKRFHKSTKGKRLHRAIGRFISTREEYDAHDITQVAELLKALCSAKTHLFIECEYYIPVDEYVDYLIFMEEFFITVNRTIQNVLEFNFDIDSDDHEFLLRVTDENAIIRGIADNSGKTFNEIRTFWDNIKVGMLKEGKTGDESDFYRTLINTIKGKIGTAIDPDSKYVLYKENT